MNHVVQQSTLVLTALYHESGRSSVAAGDTLAHSVGQAKPFTEFDALTGDAREGRLLTATNLMQRIVFTGLVPTTSLNEPLDQAEHLTKVAWLAVVIHDSEREAIERGLVVVKLNPPRPWIPFADLPDVAKAGRRRQAAFFLNRFTIEAVSAS